MTPAQLAARLHRDLGALAADAGWDTIGVDDQPQGSYSDPIADALEAAGLADLEDATAAELKAIRRTALSLCLDRLELHYAQAVDTSGDGLSESFSQIGQAIARARANLVGRVAVGANLRGVRRVDYDANLGNSTTKAGEYEPLLPTLPLYLPLG